MSRREFLMAAVTACVPCIGSHEAATTFSGPLTRCEDDQAKFKVGADYDVAARDTRVHRQMVRQCGRKVRVAVIG